MGGEQMDAGRRLRADAERNRALILDAAREVFAERGLDAPLDEVARRAGVGEATLHRRFPGRGELVACAFEAKMAEYADAVATALADPDPWAGFCAYLEHVCAMQSRDRGFAHVLTMTFPAAREFEDSRARAYAGLVTLVQRAQLAGALRRDFVPEDVVLLLMANAGVVAATAGTAPGAWRRLVAYLLQAFAAGAAQPLPPAPEPRQMYRAMVRSRQAT